MLVPEQDPSHSVELEPFLVVGRKEIAEKGLVHSEDGQVLDVRVSFNGVGDQVVRMMARSRATTQTRFP